MLVLCCLIFRALICHLSSRVESSRVELTKARRDKQADGYQQTLACAVQIQFNSLLAHRRPADQTNEL